MSRRDSRSATLINAESATLRRCAVFVSDVRSYRIGWLAFDIQPANISLTHFISLKHQCSCGSSADLADLLLRLARSADASFFLELQLFCLSVQIEMNAISMQPTQNTFANRFLHAAPCHSKGKPTTKRVHIFGSGE